MTYVNIMEHKCVLFLCDYYVMLWLKYPQPISKMFLGFSSEIVLTLVMHMKTGVPGTFEMHLYSVGHDSVIVGVEAEVFDKPNTSISRH